LAKFDPKTSPLKQNFTIANDISKAEFNIQELSSTIIPMLYIEEIVKFMHEESKNFFNDQI
jgi:hypothetical protein